MISQVYSALPLHTPSTYSKLTSEGTWRRRTHQSCPSVYGASGGQKTCVPYILERINTSQSFDDDVAPLTGKKNWLFKVAMESASLQTVSGGNNRPNERARPVSRQPGSLEKLITLSGTTQAGFVLPDEMCTSGMREALIKYDRAVITHSQRHFLIKAPFLTRLSPRQVRRGSGGGGGEITQSS